MKRLVSLLLLSLWLVPGAAALLTSEGEKCCSCPSFPCCCTGSCHLPKMGTSQDGTNGFEFSAACDSSEIDPILSVKILLPAAENEKIFFAPGLSDLEFSQDRYLNPYYEPIKPPPRML